MKVLLVNGSPNVAGCTYTALSEVAKELNKAGIESEIFHIGDAAIAGCNACGMCRQIGKCVFDDSVNACLEKVKECDGFIVGSPVYYASANGALTAFLDRLFFSGGKNFYLKAAAAVASARRAGTTATLDQLNKYFLISQMTVIGSQYWNMVHGSTPDDVREDMEGMQIMRTLGRNMAYFLKCRAAADAAGVALPEREDVVRTNFIR